MLRSIQLFNFQSHKDIEVEFSPGVNVIVGPSRHGKTSLLRAIRWVAENRPTGDEFRSHWAKKGIACVRLDLDSGETVERLKGTTSNKYILNGEDFSGFGQDVPKPVAEALNQGDLNLQGQFDTPFLLFDSPGAAPRYLNQVVHLDAIDTAMANISSLKRQSDQDIRSCEARIGELEAARDSFPDLGSAEEYVAWLEGQQAELGGKTRGREALALLQGRIASSRQLLDEARLPNGIEERADGLLQKSSRKAQLGYTKQMLAKIQESLSEGLASMARLVILLVSRSSLSLVEDPASSAGKGEGLPA